MNDRMIYKLSLLLVIRNPRLAKRAIRRICSRIERQFKERRLYPEISKVVAASRIIDEILDKREDIEFTFLELEDLDQTEFLIVSADKAMKKAEAFSELYKNVSAEMMSKRCRYLATLRFTRWLQKQYENLLSLGIPERDAILRKVEVIVHNPSMDNREGAALLRYRDIDGVMHERLYRYARQWRCQGYARPGTAGQHSVVLKDVDQSLDSHQLDSLVTINSRKPAPLNETVKHLAEQKLKITLLAQAGYEDQDQYVN